MYLLTVLILLFQTAQAQFTAIPDSNFEQALIDLGYDDVLDGQVLTANIMNIPVLYIDVLGIQDLTGIQDFAALTELDVWGNLLTTINVSQNTNLEFLYIGDNPLITLDISNNINLIEVWADFTSLTSLNTSNNPNLTSISLWDCNITSLDLSNNTQLQGLDVDGNNLTALDLSNNPNLQVLYCEGNTNLSFVNLKNGNTAGINDLYAQNIATNACIQVDDAAAATAGTTSPYDLWWVDATSTFSEDCALSINTFASEKFLIFPNPTTDKLTFVNATIASFEIYDSKGSVVLKNKNLNSNSIEVANLSPGIYFIKVYNDKNQTQNIRFVKQ